MIHGSKMRTSVIRRTRRSLFALGTALLVLGASACDSVRSTALRTGPARPAYAGPVRISALTIPAGAVQVGSVVARGRGTVEDLLPQLISRTGELGGNLVLIDRVVTHFDTQTVWVSEMYPCGYRMSATCSRMVPRVDEYSTLDINARAFLVGGAP